MLAYITFSLLSPANYCVFVIIFALYLSFGVLCDLCKDQFSIMSQTGHGEPIPVHPFHTLILLQANPGYRIGFGPGELS